MSSGAPLTANGTGEELPQPGAFRFRMGSRADLPRCLELLPEGFKAPARVPLRLIESWERLLAGDARIFSIIEDVDLAHPSNITGFGLSVFVTDDFFSKFCRAPKPYLSAIFYERLLAGDHVVLTSEELRQANSMAGLNVLVLHFGLRNDNLSDPRTAQVLTVGSASFFFFHSGYRIKAIVNEVFGPQHAHYMELGGFRLMHDFHPKSSA